ncbi:MAG: hypothetical protein QW703_01130 [Candidatus Aenigmatarchaeota archaeon]
MKRMLGYLAAACFLYFSSPLQADFKLNAINEKFEAKSEMKKGNFCKAFKHYESALEMQPKYGEKSEFRSEYVDAGLSCGSQLLNMKEFEQAIDVFERTQKFGVVEEAAKNIEIAKNAISRANEMYEKGKDCIKQKKWAEARSALKEAEEIYPKLGAGKLLEEIEPVAIKDMMSKASTKLSAGLFDDAEKLYYDVLDWEPENTDAKTGLKNVWLAKGKLYETKGYYGLSLFNYLKADDAESVERVRKSLAKSIGFDFDFQIGAQNKDFLQDTLNVEEVFESMVGKWAYAGPDGKIKVVGNVKNINIDKISSIRSATKEYIASYRTERNPKYDELEREIRRVEMEIELSKQREKALESQNYGPCQSVIGCMENSSRAAQSLSESFNQLGLISYQAALQSQLSKTPQYIQVPEYAYWNYQIETVTKTACIDMSILAEDKHVCASVSDDTIHNPKPGVVEPDPLELPDDKYVIKMAAEKIANEIIPSYIRNKANTIEIKGNDCESLLRKYFLGNEVGLDSCGKGVEIFTNYVKGLIFK